MKISNDSEYVPSGKLIYAFTHDDSVWNDTYATWFDSCAARLKHLKHHRIAKSSVLCVVLHAGHKRDNRDLNVWVCFDTSNGHKPTKRYLWVFPTRAAAVSHRRQQHANQGAGLTTPQKWRAAVHV